MKKLVMLLTMLVMLPKWSHAADPVNPILNEICTTFSCLNNFTTNTGWSFSQKVVMTGGYTDLKQNWYISPGVGFEVPIAHGPSVQAPFLDINVIFKVGQLLSDKIPPIHTFVNSSPFIAGIMKYSTIGESGGWDYENSKLFDCSWMGFSLTF